MTSTTVSLNCGMRIQVPTDAKEDLLEFLCGAECRAEIVDDETVDVDIPATLGEEQARMEVDLYLKTWQANRPDFEAHLLFDPPRSRVAEDTPAAD